MSWNINGQRYRTWLDMAGLRWLDIYESTSLEITGYPKVYDLDRNLIGILENAFEVSYTKSLNELWTASFSLPANDPKVELCKPFYYVEIFDGEERVELFRIVPQKTVYSDNENAYYFTLEHCLATLIDDVLFKYHQLSNDTTTENINYILNKQSTQNWVLGTSNFNRMFEYKFENENLLTALFSLTDPLENFEWSFNTKTYPWTLNLLNLSEELSAEVRYGRNLIGVEMEVDPTAIITRIYPLGSGEGDNQLTIKSVNPTGLSYIEADTRGTYGLKQYVWVDRRFENANSLYDSALAHLNKYKVPKFTLRVDAGDLYRITNEPLDKFQIGKLIRVYHEDLKLNYLARVVGISKADINRSPNECQIEIANRTENIAGALGTIGDRQRIDDVYSQGATNIDTFSFSDNADSSNPAILKFYLHEDTVRINKLILSYECGKFRAYSKTVKAGGSTTTTTASGGTTTTASGGTTTTASGGETTNTDSSTVTVNYSWAGESVFNEHDHPFTLTTSPRNNSGLVDSVTPYHKHSFAHDHNLTLNSHKHTISLQGHTHSIASHTHSISSHTHSVSIDNHTHDLDYGIFLYPNEPTAIELYVDGALVTGETSTNKDDLNLIPYLSKDSEGKINRGWHTVEIKPNDLARITANIVSKVFIQSRGGGDY